MRAVIVRITMRKREIEGHAETNDKPVMVRAIRSAAHRVLQLVSRSARIYSAKYFPRRMASSSCCILGFQLYDLMNLRVDEGGGRVSETVFESDV